MAADTFDILSLVSDLEAAGIKRRRAEATRKATGTGIEHLAIKTFVLQVAIGIVSANVTLTAGLLKLP